MATPSQARTDVMPLKEFSERTGWHYQSAWEHARQNSLPIPTLKIGRKYFVSRRAYEAWLNGQQHAPEARIA